MINKIYNINICSSTFINQHSKTSDQKGIAEKPHNLEITDNAPHLHRISSQQKEQPKLPQLVRNKIPSRNKKLE